MLPRLDVKMQFLEALFFLSEWQTLYSLLESSQPKGITVTREKVVVAVILIFSYKIREKEGCFWLRFYKD